MCCGLFCFFLFLGNENSALRWNLDCHAEVRTAPETAHVVPIVAHTVAETVLSSSANRDLARRTIDVIF